MPARWLAAVALLPTVVPFLPLDVAATPVEAVCQRPAVVSFFDQNVGSQIDVHIAEKKVRFTTPEGSVHVGERARIGDDGRHLDASYVSKTFSVLFRADLTYGRARAQASELVVPPAAKPVPRGAVALLRRPYTRLWTLTVLGGPPQEGDCRLSLTPTPIARV